MVDLNKKIENEALKALITDFGLSRNENLLGDIYELFIMSAQFLVVTSFSNQDASETVTLDEGTSFTIPHISNDKKEHFVPLFTDWNELAKWEILEAPVQTLVMGFDDVAALVQSDPTVSGVVINPLSQNYIFPRHFVEDFKTQKEIRLQGVSKQVIKEDTEVMIGDPKVYPTEMIAAIVKHLETQAQVKRAWLRYMVRSGEASYLVIVDFEGEQAPTSRGIGQTATPYLTDHYLDIMKYDRESDIGKGLEGVDPFFVKREKQGFFKKIRNRKSA